MKWTVFAYVTRRRISALVVLGVIATILMSCGQAPVIKHAAPINNLLIPTVSKPVDIHAGMIFESAGRIYWVGDTYGCGYVLLSPASKYCGEVGYSATSINGPWQGPVMLFNPSDWQSQCGAPNYGCFRPHIVWNPNTNDWRMWLNVSHKNNSGYAVFSAADPLGPYAYIGQAKVTVTYGSQLYGDEALFVDNNMGYAAYTVVSAKDNMHSIAIEQLDPTFQFGTGKAALLPIPQLVESPSIFEHDGSYYITYSDPACPFCDNAGTSYAIGSTPLGPFTETRHNITHNSCGGQPASVNEINGQLIYQSDLWTGSFNETSALQYWEVLQFAGNTIAPLAC